MALVFFDGFEHGLVTGKHPVADGCSIVAGRNGNGIRLGTFGQVLRTPVLPSHSSYYTGFAYRKTVSPTNNWGVMNFNDAGLTQHLLLIWRTDRTFSIRREGDNVILGTTIYQLPLSTWVHLQIAVTIHDSLGVYRMLADGVEILNLTNVDTRNGGVGTLNLFDHIATDGGGNQQDLDDIWYCDGSGSAPTNGLLGDLAVGVKRPTGAGNSTIWTPSAGSNWECVEDANNGDTDYVSASVLGDRDTYETDNISGGATIYGATPFALARKDDAGTRGIKTVTRTGGTNYLGTEKILTTDYALAWDLQTVNPNTGLPWTASEINAAEFGQEVST